MDRDKRPSVLSFFLGLLIDKSRADAIAGDISEICEDIIERRGRSAGLLWYFGELLKTVPGLFLLRLRWIWHNNITSYRLAFRALRKNRIYSVLNILGLSVGIGVFVLMSLMVHYELGYDSFHKKSEEIYQLGTVVKTAQGPVKQWVTGPRVTDFVKESYPEVENASRMLDHYTSVATDSSRFKETVSFVDHDFFEIFNFRRLSGEGISSPDSALITLAYAEKFFGNRDCLGKTFSIVNHRDRKQIFRVVGILENIPVQSSIRGNIFLPFSSLQNVLSKNFFNGWGNFCLSSFVRINSDSTAFTEKLNEDLKEQGKYRFTFMLENIRNIHFSHDVHAADVEPVNPLYLWIAFSIGVIILLMGIMNLMNISYARLGEQMAAAGIRKVLGASGRDVFGQVLREYILIGFIASSAGVIVTLILKQRFGIELTGSLSAWIISMLCCSVAVGIMAGFIPSWILAGGKPSGLFRGGTVKGKKWFTWAGIFIQFSLITALLFCGIVMRKQLDYMRNYNLGFNENVFVALNVNTDNNRKFVQLFRNKSAGYRSIVSVSGVETIPGLSFSETRVTVMGEKYHTKISLADRFFVQTAGLKTLKGAESFLHGDLVINRKAEEMMRGEWEGTKMIRGGESMGVIKAVVENYNIFSLHETIPPVTYRIDDKFKPDHMIIRASGNSRNARRDIVRLLRLTAPDYKVKLHSIKSLFNRSYRTDEKWNSVVDTATLISLLVALFGLTGVSIVILQKREKEIGIRKVMGASRWELSVRSTFDLVKWAVIALIPALIAGYYAVETWLGNFAYKTEIGITPYFAASLLALITAFITSGIQSWRAASTDPLKTINRES